MRLRLGPMFYFRKPSDEEIREYLARQASQPFSYDCVGCTRDTPELRRGWSIDRARVLLGRGEAAFQKARGAIESWQMFPREVASICWPEAPREGLLAAVVYWAAPVRLWILFPTRVVYVLNGTITSSSTSERDGRQIEQFGFGYGTLPDHPERGEERFMVEWDHNDDNVWYEVLAVSRPAHWLARIGYPYTRYEQARFRRLSCAAMKRAVAG
jgi:uncharacterized protein (UPF0548 family)